jgi:CheY-like chemotaxis protein
MVPFPSIDTAVRSPEDASGATASYSIPPQEILLVDDDPMILRALRLMLESDGHIVTTADGGEAAFSALAGTGKSSSRAFPVVMTDLEMPNFDGCQVACAVKTASPATLVFLLTGWAERFTLHGILPAYVDKVLNKPPQRSEIRAALQLLTRRQ